MPRPASEVRWELLHEVARDLRYLLERGYHKLPALNFVANRWQLLTTEREILARAVFHPQEARRRRKKRVRVRDLRQKLLLVDAHNVIITVESAIKGLPVFQCDDGFVRDARRLSRKFRPSQTTTETLNFLLQSLKRLCLREIDFYFDAPLSKSGELAAEVRRLALDYGLAMVCHVVPSADKALLGARLLASSDAALIDAAEDVFDLSAYVLHRLQLKPQRL